MSLADEVRTVRQRVAERLDELEPLVREYEELLELARELGIEEPNPGRSAETAATSTPRSRAAGRSAGEDGDAGAKGRGGRRAGSGSRSRATRQRRQQPAAGAVPEPGPERDALVIEALRAQPGATIADLASVLGVPPTSLYRTVRELTSSGAVVKRGRGLFVES